MILTDKELTKIIVHLCFVILEKTNVRVRMFKGNKGRKKKKFL